MISKARSLVLLFLTCSFVGMNTEMATGATYDVQTCREEVRELLPSTDWSSIGPTTDFSAETDCKSGPLSAGPTGFGPTRPGGEGGLRFSVPKPLAIVGIKYRQLIHTAASTYPPGQWSWDFESRQTTVDGKQYRTGGCPGNFISSCSEAYGRISYLPLDRLSALDWVFICSSASPQACPHDSEVDISLYDGSFKVDDSEGPQIAGQPSGALFAGVANLSGDQTVVFQATDRGSGIYRATVEVDGADMGEALLNRDTPTCQPPFHVSQPCPLEVVNSVVVDTARLADGQHDAYLKVYDATDENRAVYGPVSFSTSNRTVASFCASEAASRFQLRLPRRSVRFGKAWRLGGRLNDAAGWEAVLLDGRGKVSVLGTAIVSGTGHIQMEIPRGPNRFARLAIRPPGSRDKYVCSPPKLVRVRPKLTLSVSPRETTNGGSVTVGGHLYGKARAGKAIVIQARARGSRRWATIRVIRTKRSGRYQMRYRFRNSSVGTTYIFRSQARGERGYPYSTGTSTHRHLRILGTS